MITLHLKFDHILKIFAPEEYKLLNNEFVLFSRRLMLSDIYKQIPEQYKSELYKSFPNVCKLLNSTRLIEN